MNFNLVNINNQIHNDIEEINKIQQFQIRNLEIKLIQDAIKYQNLEEQVQKEFHEVL